MTHKPITSRPQSRCRVSCSCGWQGPIVPTFGLGFTAWREHWHHLADEAAAS